MGRSVATTKFQFHNGTINTQQQQMNHLEHSRFNSTTVQLIRSPQAIKSQMIEFQFHNGTINTALVKARKKKLTLVSIPQRYN